MFVRLVLWLLIGGLKPTTGGNLRSVNKKDAYEIESESLVHLSLEEPIEDLQELRGALNI